MRNLRISKQITNRDERSLDLYLQDINKLNLVTVEEEAELARKIRNGDLEAHKRLILANLRFVVSVAKQYQNMGLTFADLINEGNLGLVKAAGRFDETRGFKFISYAVWWIRQSILQGLAENSRIIRLPLNKIGTLSKINQAFIQLEQNYQREPTPEEIAEMLNFTINEVKVALQTKNFHVSMDAPLHESEGDNFTLYDSLSDDDLPGTDNLLLKNSLKIEIDRMMGILDIREALILRYYYGLIGDCPLTIDEIAVKLKLTRERVRQLRDKTLKKLHHAKISSRLRSYLE